MVRIAVFAFLIFFVIWKQFAVRLFVVVLVVLIPIGIHVISRMRQRERRKQWPRSAVAADNRVSVLVFVLARSRRAGTTCRPADYGTLSGLLRDDSL
jgi:hypothetical protein